jgi:hypothetical protein
MEAAYRSSCRYAFTYERPGSVVLLALARRDQGHPRRGGRSFAGSQTRCVVPFAA